MEGESMMTEVLTGWWTLWNCLEIVRLGGRDLRWCAGKVEGYVYVEFDQKIRNDVFKDLLAYPLVHHVVDWAFPGFRVLQYRLRQSTPWPLSSWKGRHLIFPLLFCKWKNREGFWSFVLDWERGFLQVMLQCDFFFFLN